MDSSNLNATWQRICDQIKGYGTVNPLQVDAFFGRLQPQAIAEGYIFITADTELIKSMVEKRFMPTLQQALKDLYGIDYMVEIEVDPTQAQIVGRREGDIEQVWAKPDKANNVLGWKADTPIEEVLLSAWRWEQKIRS